MTPLERFLDQLNSAELETSAWNALLKLLHAYDVPLPENFSTEWLEQAAGGAYVPAASEEGELAIRIATHYMLSQLAAIERKTVAKAVHLTKRECQTLNCVAHGLTSKAAARKIGSTFKTVDLHIENARKRLGAATRVEAVAKAINLGLILLPSGEKNNAESH
ncbi:MAG: LuxR C-terminal-related transcriptional regulator [Rhodospirillales bacterium]|nr:LuxR C-terminal-related transcriptional regulator [Rhodospirillales bacterium]